MVTFPALSVIIRDLDVFGMAVVPDETDSPLVIDPDAVLSFSVAFQDFQTVAGRRSEVFQLDCGMHMQKLSESDPLNIRRDSPRSFPVEDPLGFLVPE